MVVRMPCNSHKKAKMSGQMHSPLRITLAWCVHAYTALGLPVSAVMAYLIIVQPLDASFRWAFVMMLVATFVDCTDGPVARAIRIREVLPGFDGRRLDDLVDWLTYTCLPLLLIWKAGLLGSFGGWWLIVPLMASAYGFCQVSIKTDDGYFLGFPSLWNIIAFYLYALQPMPASISLGLILLLSVLTFVPLRYLYPNQPGLLNRLTILFGAAWCVLLGWIFAVMPNDNERSESVKRLTIVSLIFPIYYFISSWIITWRLWRTRVVRGEG